jgi:outer membrane protein assembly factor BamB
MTKRNMALSTMAIAVFTAALCGADWPQWRGPNRDAKVAGFSAPATWPKTLTQKWKVTVGTADATPALVGDRLYVFARQGGDEVTLCLDAAKGTEIWRDAYPAIAVTGGPAQHPGPRSSPTVADGKVVTLGVGGILSCLNASDGRKIWRNEDYKIFPQWYTAASPMVVDGVCFAQLGTDKKGTFLALDLATGKEKWKWDGEGPSYASPVLLDLEGTKQIVALTESSVIGLGVANNTLLWKLPFAVQGMGANAATPIVDGQNVIYTGQNRGTKAVKIEKTGDGFAVKELWTNPDTIGTRFNSPVLKDGYIYGLSDRNALFCIDAKTGKTAWTWSGPPKMDNFGAVLDAGSVMVALPTTEMIVFKPSSEKYEEVARLKVGDTPVYSTPILSGKMIYIKDQDSVIAYTIE